MLDLPEDTILSHASKGRLRLKVPSKKRNPAFFEQLQGKLKEVPGLTEIRVNPLSASILILHTDLPDEISAWLQAHNALSTKGDPLLHPNNVHKRISGTFNEVNGRIRGFTKGELDVPTLSFIALLTVGIYQISRGNFTAPAWYTAFWYAMNIFLKSKE
jgi:hypothetical protein